MEKPGTCVGPMVEESAGTSGKIIVAPFLELDMRA